MAYVGESVCSYEPSDDEGSDGLSLPREPSDGQLHQETAKIRDRKTSALVGEFAMTEKVKLSPKAMLPFDSKWEVNSS